jgi:hypothetical protein
VNDYKQWPARTRGARYMEYKRARAEGLVARCRAARPPESVAVGPAWWEVLESGGDSAGGLQTPEAREARLRNAEVVSVEPLLK